MAHIREQAPAPAADTTNSWRQRWVGRWIVGVALIHTVFGFAAFGDVIATIIRRGVVDTVGGDSTLGAVVWFLLFGAVLALFGLAVAAIEKTGQPLPLSLGWSLLALVAAGVLLMPASGFWLALPPALSIIRRRNG